MADERRERCPTCRFWESYRGTGSGCCMRFPPQMSETAVKFYVKNPDEDEVSKCVQELLIRTLHSASTWFYPTTLEDDWCGEWQPKTPADSSTPVYDGPLGLRVRTVLLDDRTIHLGSPGVCVRTINIIERDFGVGMLVRDLVAMTAEDLLALRGFGQVTLKYVRNALAVFGLSLRGDPPCGGGAP